MPLSPVAKPATYLDLGPVDIGPLLPLVARLSETTWSSEDGRKENRFECFHNTQHIVFRFTPGNQTPEDFYTNPTWDVWSPHLLPVISQAIAAYGFTCPEVPKAMLARLEAGHTIDRHRDGAGSNLVTHKIHVPLVTNPLALFESGGEVRHLEVGRAYEVNNIGEHSARNDGDKDRIHLIFEVFDAASLDAAEFATP